MNFTFEGRTPKEERSSNFAKIEQSGFYVASIISAELINSNSSMSKGIEFVVKTKNNETGKFKLWVINTEGKPNQIAIDKVKELVGITLGGKDVLKQGKILVNKFDYETKKEWETEVDGYPQLKDKEVGILVSALDKEYNGKVYKEINLINFYTADGRDVDELLENKPAKALDNYLAYMKKNINKYGGSVFIDSSIIGEVLVEKEVQQKDELPKVELKEDNIPF